MEEERKSKTKKIIIPYYGHVVSGRNMSMKMRHQLS